MTYSLCFMMLLLVARRCSGACRHTESPSIAWFVPPFHMYRQLRGAYGLRRSARCGALALLPSSRSSPLLFAVAVVLLGRSRSSGAGRRRSADRAGLRPLGLRDRGTRGRDRGALVPPRSIVSPAITFLISSPDSVSYSSSAWARLRARRDSRRAGTWRARSRPRRSCGFPCRSPAPSRSTSGAAVDRIAEEHLFFRLGILQRPERVGHAPAGHHVAREVVAYWMSDEAPEETLS